MTNYGGKDLASAFRTVRKNTIQVAVDIPEPQYGHVAAPECRSVAQMFTHVALSPQMWEEIHGKQRLKTLVGFDFIGLAERVKAEEAKPRTNAEILELLTNQGDRFAGWLETLSPEFLAESVITGDGTTAKSRFEQIMGVKEHEMHHRAQLMLIERQLGIVPHLTKKFNEQLERMRAARA
jgi:uncharacterized damage-inducible protein DinB